MRLTKKHSFLWGGVLLTSVCMGCINPKTCLKDENTCWMLSDTVIHKQLGQNLTDIFFYPNSVRCYYISYKDSVKNCDKQVIKSYVRDSLFIDLNKSQIATLQFILPSNFYNYSNDTIKVQSPYIPCLEFEFSKKGNKPASILVSTSDHSWQIVQNGIVHSTHNYVESRSIERFCQYFINKHHNKKGETK